MLIVSAPGSNASASQPAIAPFRQLRADHASGSLLDNVALIPEPSVAALTITGASISGSSAVPAGTVPGALTINPNAALTLNQCTISGNSTAGASRTTNIAK